MDVDALRFRTAQGKTRKANLHQQGIGTDRTARHDADRLALDKAEFAQAFCNRIVVVQTGDGINYCGRKRKEL